MKRALMFGAGVLLGLVAEYLLWEGPVWYAYEDWWFSIRSTRIIGLGLIVLGAEAAAAAAFCLARVSVPLRGTPAQSRMTLAGPVRAAVWRRPVLPICAILFFLGAVGAFFHARDVFDTLQGMESVPGGYSRDIIGACRLSGQVALTFGILYSTVGAALLVAPMLLKARGWQWDQRINGAGCGISLVGHLLGAVGFLLWVGNGLMMEGAQDSLSLVANLAVLGGIGLAVVGSMVAAVRGLSSSRKEPRDAEQDPPAYRGGDADLP